MLYIVRGWKSNFCNTFAHLGRVLPPYLRQKMNGFKPNLTGRNYVRSERKRPLISMLIDMIHLLIYARRQKFRIFYM